MNLLRGKSSERGSVVSESERQCGVRVMGEWELLRLSVLKLVRMLYFGWEVSEAKCTECTKCIKSVYKACTECIKRVYLHVQKACYKLL